MTTIILTIIGILLAGASSLMLVFYGGDAFTNSKSVAAAATIQGAGSNVANAMVMYRNDTGQLPSALTDLTTNSGPGGVYLKESPVIPVTVENNASATNIASVTSPSGSRAFTVNNVSRETCARINSNLNVTVASIGPTVPSTVSSSIPKMGCAMGSSGNGIFYAAVAA